MSETFLAFQSSYTTVEIALFKGNVCCQIITLTKFDASKHLTIALDTLLTTHHLSLADITFIAVNRGPGPFTTLRTVIASVNGLSFATNLPLIGVDGLEVFAQEFRDQHYPVTVYLLNAFAKQVYYCIQQEGQADIVGCCTLTDLLTTLKADFAQQPIRFLGSGVALYADLIKETFNQQAVIPAPMPEQCSIKQVACVALAEWRKGRTGSFQLSPVYLKAAF